ncbi:MAG: hypothetical protein V1911_01070, partial [Candidatus Micrarchaeota archaeon]
AESGEFVAITDVSLESQNKNSLAASVYFKEMCISAGLPCKLVIGSKDNMYYAWIKAYEGGWQDINVFANTKTAPEGYTIFYEEPVAEVHFLSATDIQAIYDAVSFVKVVEVDYSFLYLVFLAAAGGGFLFFLKKKIDQMKTESPKKDKLIRKTDINGDYRVLNKDVDQPFLVEIIKKIEENKGKVDMKKYSEELRYSEDLVKFAVTYLVDMKKISSENAMLDYTEHDAKKEKQADVQKPGAEKAAFNMQSLAPKILEKMSFGGKISPKELMVVAGILGGAAILIIVLLMS